MKRTAMNRSSFVPLARASTATKGAWGVHRDEVLMQAAPGLTHD